MTRRDLLRAGAAGVAVCFGATACTEDPFACMDTTGVSANDQTTRVALSYVDASPEPAKPCHRCTQWLPASASGTCGGCKILKGPIHPNGSCKAFAAKS
jgi:hypothetical protein